LIEMGLVTLLAQHAGGEKTLWDPTILGVLVTLSAIGLFCGSAYLLLGTNLGGRLGFLVAGACLTGFMVLLSSLWITTATPLNSPKGRPAGWEVKEVVDTPTDATVSEVRDLESGDPVGVEELAQLRPALDQALVTQEAEGAAEAPEQPFAQFGRSTEFLTEFEGYRTFTTGGDSENLFWHTPRYAVVEICNTLEVEVASGEAPPAPTCDPLTPKQYVVMEYDFGSLRQPTWVYFFTSLVLFGLFLLGLHWYEQDARERQRGALRPVPTP
jgi:hypothetical protein